MSKVYGGVCAKIGAIAAQTMLSRSYDLLIQT